MENSTPDQQQLPEEGTAAAAPDTVMIKSIEQFGELLYSWHEKNIATLEHLMQVPEGIEVVIDDQEPFKLEGDMHKGFVLGLQMSLNFMGQLPFSRHEEPESVH